MSVKDVLKPSDEGFAGKIVGDKEVKSYVKRILRLKEEADNINADIKSVYDEAADKGLDRSALKTVVKISRKDVSEEHKQTVNAYLNAIGDLPLFATAMVN